MFSAISFWSHSSFYMCLVYECIASVFCTPLDFFAKPVILYLVSSVVVKVKLNKLQSG